MSDRRSRTLPLALTLLGALSGCMSSGERPEFDFPSYVSPTNVRGFVGWSVKCPLQTISNPQSTDASIFYNADGSEKSLEQFCDENDSSTRIPPQTNSRP